ncbi:Transposase ISC1173 [Sulfuracidifex tepidarius]|uniref:Transposase ISC1173 n=1 Tax=Sulfuracidifex tepidarius TaxID=1294262 RepID=A0A510E5T6_9CREN|nr:Transposase ISC1173 [Sulfuracidifex tepidarius]BBG27859.1 Transposase ISC1173 [Sulfuracidifex tepidarius]
MVRDCPSRGRIKYKCRGCGRTFYSTLSHRISREQRDRDLRKYLNRTTLGNIRGGGSP